LPIDKQERLASIVRSEIRLPGEQEPHDWNAFQGSSISSCSLLTPLRLLPGSDAVDPAFVEAFKPIASMDRAGLRPYLFDYPV